MLRLERFVQYGLALILLVVIACSKEQPAGPLAVVEPSVESVAGDSVVTPPDSKHPNDTIQRLHWDNRTAVVNECKYALRRNWQSVSYHWQRTNSTWEYLLSDPNAYGVVKSWFGGYSSEWHGWPSFYSNMNVYSWTPLNRSGRNTGVYRSHGGQCRYFANLILFRSGTYQRRLPSYGRCPGGYRSYRQIYVGDVIETNWANGHTAIVVGILEGSAGSSVRRVVVVDSNYIGDEEIGMHVLAVSGSGVGNLANYRALNLGY